MTAINEKAAMIKAAQNGDSQAFESLMQLYQNDIYHTALFMLKNEEDAKDITQEVFIKLFKNLSQLQNIDAFDSWIRIITINECKMFFRKNAHAEIPVEEIDETEDLLKTYQQERTDEIPHEKLDRMENDKILYSLIEGLPEKYSRVLILFYYAEMSYSEIAVSLKISEGTVKSRLFTAKKKLGDAILAYEKRHDIVLHTEDVMGSMGRWLMQVFAHTDTLSQSAVRIAPAALQSATSHAVSTHAVSAVSTTVSHSVASKVSIAVASVSVAVCVGITARVFPTNSVNLSDIDSLSSQTESVIQSEVPESSVEELSQVSESTFLQDSETVSVEPSVIYVHDQAEPSVIYRDREVIREAEPSVVYINSENVRRYDQYVDLSTNDGEMEFRIYPENNEALLKFFSKEDGDVILPSYVNYEDRQVPVTRMMYNFLSAEDDEKFRNSEPFVLQLPEKLESIPESCFDGRKVKAVIGGTSVVSIGRNAFRNCLIKELDMREVFPNAIEIDDSAFKGCPLEKLVLPESVLRVSGSAFYDTNLKEVTTIPVNDFGAPAAETVHLIIPGSTIRQPQYHFWAEASLYSNPIGIQNLYFELQDRNAVIDDSRTGFGELKTALFHLLDYTVADNCYLPEGMKKLRANEFESVSTELPEYQDPETGVTKYQQESAPQCDYHGKIKNLYISSTITEIEPDAFTSKRGVIKNIILPKAGRSNRELRYLKNSILKSKQFRFVSEDAENLFFTDPDAVFPEGKYHIEKLRAADSIVPEEEPIEEEPIEDELIEEELIEEEPFEEEE